MEEIEYIRSNKGGQKIIHRGYMYTVHKNKKCGGIRWRCAQRSLNCKGSISTTSLGVPYLNIPHNHMPDAQSIAIARNKIFDHGAIDFHNFLDLLINDEHCSSGPAVLDVTNVWEPLTELEDEDSMPLEQRLKVPASTTVLTPPPEAQATEQVLQSQPLSPTKLKVTRQVKPSAPSPIPPPLPLPIEEVCLRWNSHHSNMQHTFPNLLLREQYVDATLVADGQTLKCHRVILSSCSPYFEDVLASISPYQHPVLFMKDVPFWILKCLCDFMYSGEVHILQTKLEDLLVVAETLKIKGLAVQPDTKMIDRKPEFTIPIKEEKFDEKEIKKKEEKEFRRKEEKEVKKREEKEIKKKEEKEVKKKEEKEVKKKEEKEFKKKDEKEIKKKEETKLLEIKPLKKKEEKEFAKKDEKQTKKKEEMKEIKEKKRVTIIPSPERPVIKNAKVPKVVIQTPVPILKNLGVKANRPRSAVESKKRDRKLEKEKLAIEKIPITADTPSTSSFANPFGLLKPVYEEVTKDPKPSKVAVVKDPKNVNVKRTLQKKLKKRKLTDEREESPPPALSRKGTRSRPRSKVAKYYHPTPVPSYDQSTIVREPHTDQADAFLQIQDIKSEPIYDDSIEIEDNLVGFSESSISVEEHLIDSYDSTFDNFNRRTTRHSKPIITVQSIVDQHTLKIVNVAELKENNDPLEDPLGLNQSSSDSASMAEQTDNTLGFRISKVVTAKEDSQCSDVCRELGFKIASIVSEQEEEEKLETTQLEATYEEEEFEDQKPIFSLIHPEDNNSNQDKNKMDTNEDELISCPDIISYKIKEELIENVQEEEEKTMFDREMNQVDAFEEEKTELLNQLLPKKISIIQEAHLSEENLLTPDKSDSSTVQSINTEKSETLSESELKKHCPFKSSSNVPQFEDKCVEVNEDERMGDLYIPQSSSSANVPIEDKNVTEEDSGIMDQEMRENFEEEDQPMNEDYSNQQLTGENCKSSSKNLTFVENQGTDNNDAMKSSSNIPDLSNLDKEQVLDNKEENSSNVPHDETFHCVENQLIEESSSNNPHSNLTFMENLETNTYQGTDNIETNESSLNIPDSHTEAFHCDENQLINENIEESSSNITYSVNEQKESSSAEHSEVIHHNENQPTDNNFEESSSNIPDLSNPENEDEDKEENNKNEGEIISNVLHSDGFHCNENQPIDDVFEESSSNIPDLPNPENEDEDKEENNKNDVENSSNVLHSNAFHCNENQPIDDVFEESSSNIPEENEDEDKGENSSNVLHSDAFHCNQNQPIDDGFEENIDNLPIVGESSSNITQPTVLSINENVPSVDIKESSSNVSQSDYNPHTNNSYEESAELNSSSNEGISGDLSLTQSNAQSDENYYEESNSQHDKQEESYLDPQESEVDATIPFSMDITREETNSEDSNNKNSSKRFEDESSSNVPPEFVPLPEDLQDQSMETDIDEISAKQTQVDEKEESCLDSQFESNWNCQPEVDCENFNNKNNSDVLEPYERFEDESSSNVPPDIVPVIDNSPTTDYNLHTEDMSSSNEPGFHIAQVISEQIAEIEGNRVKDTISVNEQCENKISSSNELESIVNDLSRIVGGSCEESNTGMDDTNSMADCLENLLQK